MREGEKKGEGNVEAPSLKPIIKYTIYNKPIYLEAIERPSYNLLLLDPFLVGLSSEKFTTRDFRSP